MDAQEKKIEELNHRIEVLTEALLEHLTKFDGKLELVMDRFEAAVERMVKEKIEELSKTSEENEQN